MKIDRAHAPAMSGDFRRAWWAPSSNREDPALTVIAEGIEAGDRQLRLRALGCQFGRAIATASRCRRRSGKDVLFANRRLGVAQ